MDNREAIEYLNDVRNGIHIPAPGIELPLLNDKEKEAVDLAIAALEKQIPKRKLEKDQYNENLFTLRCPTCGALICNYNERLKSYSYSVYENYCYICGQAIDFSKPQEGQDGD